MKYSILELIDILKLDYNSVMDFVNDQIYEENMEYEPDDTYSVNEELLLFILLKQGVINMSDRDGKGPEQRSPKPSKPKGGDQKGNC